MFLNSLIKKKQTKLHIECNFFNLFACGIYIPQVSCHFSVKSTLCEICGRNGICYMIRFKCTVLEFPDSNKTAKF